MAFISSLKLHEFRNYESLALSDLQSGFVVLFGENGAGKTNILEAVSLLTPGRGLRSAKTVQIQRDVNTQKPWAISSQLQTEHGSVPISTGRDLKTEKRIVRIAGQNARGQSVLSEYLSCIWLTPQMDRLFIDSSAHRRKFLDRMIFAFDPGHSGRVTRYENAMRQRSKILQEHVHPDPSWLGGLEAQMAETGVAIAAARIEFTRNLQTICDSRETQHFPRAQLSVKGTIEELLLSAPAVEVEEMFKYQLSETRTRDQITGGAASGPHKSDLSVLYAEKNMPASQCSTGEQKALLIGLILSHAELIRRERGAPPLLLLDEVAAHLDESRRRALYGILKDLGSQVWLTGTERSLFGDLENDALYFEIKDQAVIKV
tara:strand:- start:689 stop:1810 length:1122 start_codon:yes stop_codon:yes gene_type:complete